MAAAVLPLPLPHVPSLLAKHLKTIELLEPTAKHLLSVPTHIVPEPANQFKTFPTSLTSPSKIPPPGLYVAGPLQVTVRPHDLYHLNLA